MKIGNDRAGSEVVVVKQTQSFERHDSGETDPIWRQNNRGRLRKDCEAVGLVDPVSDCDQVGSDSKMVCQNED